MAQNSFTLMVQDDQGESHFHKEILSIIKDKSRTDEFLSILKKSDTSALADSSGNTLLHIVAQHNSRFAAQHLIQCGCRIDAQNNSGKTALIVAVERQMLSIDVLDVLLANNANIFVRDNSGKSALHWFVEVEGFRFPHLLWKILSNVEKQCRYNGTTVAAKLFDAGWPLPVVLSLDDVKIVEAMLALGCEIEAREPVYRRTALHEAVLLTNLECIKLLLDHGAEVNNVDAFHRTPLHYVYDQGKLHTDTRREIVKLLIARGALMYTSEEGASWSQVDPALRYGNGEVIRMLLQNDLDLARKHENDNTPAHLVATNRNADAMKALGDRNFEVNARNAYSETPLWTAAAYGNARAVEYLLERGADVNAANGDYCSPLYACVDQFSSRYENESMECVRCLLEYGADVERKVPTFVVRTQPTAFDVVQYSEIRSLGELLIAHAVLREASGTPLAKFVYRRIQSHLPFRTYYEFCRQQLTIEFYKSVTLLDLLRASDREFERYARDEQSASSMENFSREWNTKLYYFNAILQKRYAKAVRTLKLREEATALICKIMKTDYCQYPSIFDEIIGYLTESDLRNFLQVSF